MKSFFSKKIVFRAFALVWMGWLALHFLLTTVYATREVPVPETVREWSDAYSIPLFHQNWKLFAPGVPEYNVELRYRVLSRGEWSEFTDASNGNDVHSVTETIEQSICTGLGWQVANNLYYDDIGQKFDRIVASGHYQRALFFIVRRLDSPGKQIPIDSLQMQLQFRFTPAPDAAFNYQVSELNLPKEPWRDTH